MNAGRDPGPEPSERGVTDALRAAVERTLDATAAPAASTRERASELLDDVVRRGREAGDRLARGGQRASGLARLAGPGGAELSRRLDALEARLAAIEGLLRERLDREQPEEAGDRGDRDQP